jgi:hypothetical protein
MCISLRLHDSLYDVEAMAYGLLLVSADDLPAKAVENK